MGIVGDVVNESSVEVETTAKCGNVLVGEASVRKLAMFVKEQTRRSQWRVKASTIDLWDV